MQQFHTINIAFLSCTENIKMQKKKEKKKKKKKSTQFNDIPDCVTHPLSTAKRELKVQHQILLAILH